jgi:hypothetical protein
LRREKENKSQPCESVGVLYWAMYWTMYGQQSG